MTTRSTPLVDEKRASLRRDRSIFQVWAMGAATVGGLHLDQCHRSPIPNHSMIEQIHKKMAYRPFRPFLIETSGGT
jgi:hypothetical protein